MTRGGTVESSHRGCLAVVDADGTLIGGLGDVDAPIYPRSALKPFQALASSQVLADRGLTMSATGLATACASHDGTDDPQIEAAYLLALAGLDESALRCPRTWPLDPAGARAVSHPTRLAHNCSGKHAAFLWAHTVAGGEADRYLDPASPIQQRVREVIAEVTGAAATGPAVDGCGAPAWRQSLVRLGVGFARLAAGSMGLAPIRAAMTERPDLVGGRLGADHALMAADRRVIAKRGAEGVLAAGMVTARGPVGVAVKIADGAGRAAVPPVAAVLRSLGASVPGDQLRTRVPAGERSDGWVELTPHVVNWAAELGV